MKTTIQQSKHTRKERSIQVAMPLNVEVCIGADETVRLLLEITEGMDYRELYASYGRESRADEATPKQLFQLVVMGFLNRQYSTRRIETACRYDIRYMYILMGKRVPDHNRFWRFIKDHLCAGVAEGLFYQLVKQLEGMGEIEFANLFVDGTKEEANANRYSFVWAKSTGRYEARLDARLATELERMEIEYTAFGGLKDAQTWLAYLQKLRDVQGVTFVHGRGKRKTQLQRDVEMLESCLARKAKYQDYNATFKGRNSFSKTDHDATFMRMKDDHMRNGQLKPGYNLQLGVEGEYIVGVDISSERSDQNTLLPLLSRMEAGLKKAGCERQHARIVADAGYESEENYLGVRARGQQAYIKPQNYERSKTRKYRTNAYLRENMPYDPDTDTYTCPAGKRFAHIHDTKRHTKTGYEATLAVYECFGCQGCPQKKLCTRTQGNRRLTLSRKFLALRQEALERITTETGKLLRLNRSIQSEGAFGVLKQDYGFRRYLRRGMLGVMTETLLYAIAYNIGKLHNKIMQTKSGCTLHALNSA